jgi:hypothetical protein
VNLSRRVLLALVSAALLLGLCASYVYAEDSHAEAHFRPWVGPQASSFLQDRDADPTLEIRSDATAARLSPAAAPIVVSPAALAGLEHARARHWMRLGHARSKPPVANPAPAGSALLELLSAQQRGLSSVAR